MLHQRENLDISANPVPSALSGATRFRAHPGTRRNGNLPAAWWIVPVVLGGASLWVAGIMTAIGALTGMA
jgi:hypothetical protein